MVGFAYFFKPGGQRRAMCNFHLSSKQRFTLCGGGVKVTPSEHTFE